MTSKITGPEPGEGGEGAREGERAEDAQGADRRMYEPERAAELESLDRTKPFPGNEPPCPACGTKVVRHVEAHPYPRGDSPFRVRLMCPNPECRRWTLYDW